MIPVGSRARGTRGAAGHRRDVGGGDGGGGGGGDAGARFYTSGPPTRSGATVTYPADGHSSIVNAVVSLNSGDELYIEPGTYSEAIDLRGVSVADNITIRGDLQLSFDANGKASVAQEGPTIQASDALQMDLAPYSLDTQITSAVSVGDSVINVADATPYSAGDAITIAEQNTRPFGEPASGGASGASDTVEFATIASVDTTADQLTLQHPVYLPYPLNNAAYVAGANFNVEDIHITGLRFDGTGAASTNVRLHSVKDAWVDNVISTNVTSSPNNLFAVYRGYHNRFDGVYLHTGGHYGLNFTDFSTDNMATNISSANHNRYTVRYGPNGESAAGGYVDGIYGENLSRTVGGVHHGGFTVDYQNLYAQDAQAMVFRSRNLTLDGFTKDGLEGPDIVFAQRPFNVDCRNGTIQNPDPAKTYVFRFRMRDGTGTSGANGNERFDQILIENIDIEQFGTTPITDIGHFEVDGTPPTSGSLTFRNITYAGQQLQRSDVTSWDGYDSSLIDNLTVE